MIALAFSLKISDQIVLLARVSFAGTALMAPMILLGVLSRKKVSWIGLRFRKIEAVWRKGE